MLSKFKAHKYWEENTDIQMHVKNKKMVQKW